LLRRLPKLMQLPRMRSNPFSDVSGMCTIAD
jgi:hypothetical protein